METLSHTNAVRVSKEEFLTKQFDVPVVCQIGPADYVKHRDGRKFELEHFFKNPGEYVSIFKPFTEVTDIYIAAHYWDPASPAFFTPEDVKSEKFRISVIADVSCDINGPIPTTLRPTTIADPFYGYNILTGKEEKAFKDPKNITVMSVDNLPGELPRDSSSDFGRQLMEEVLPLLFTTGDGEIIRRATICENGALTKRYSYLSGYLEGK